MSNVPAPRWDSIDEWGPIADAIRRIKVEYDDSVSVYIKGKSLLRFGRGTVDNSTYTTLWATSDDDLNETYPAANTNSIDSVSSGSANDTGDVVIEGHSETGGNKTFVSQTVTLTGQTRAPLTTALNRVSLLYNDGASDLTGPVYVYENTTISSGKPTDTSKIHLTVPSGLNQSEKAATSLSSVDYWIISEMYADFPEKTGSNVAEIDLQIRKNGKTFLQQADISVSTGMSTRLSFRPYLIAPKNSDVRLTALASAATQDISGGVMGFLAKISSD